MNSNVLIERHKQMTNPNILIIGYTPAQQLEIFRDHELSNANDVPEARRVFIQHNDGTLSPLNHTLVVMYGEYDDEQQ